MGHLDRVSRWFQTDTLRSPLRCQSRCEPLLGPAAASAAAGGVGLRGAHCRAVACNCRPRARQRWRAFKVLNRAQAIPCLLRAICPKPRAPAQPRHDLTTRRDENKQVDRAPRALRISPRPRVVEHRRIDGGERGCQSSGIKDEFLEIFAIYMSTVYGTEWAEAKEVARKPFSGAGSFLRFFADPRSRRWC